MRIAYLTVAAAVVSSACIASASAQSRLSAAYVGVANPDYYEGAGPAPYLAIASGYDVTGQPVTASVTDQTFTGLNTDNDEQTMSLTARATATGDYGILRTGVTARVSNTFYNSTNTPYYNHEPDSDDPDTFDDSIIDEDGVPDHLIVTAYATYTDLLQFGGTATGYKSRYTFAIYGDFTGDHVGTFLNVTINGTNESFSLYGPGSVAEIFTTNAYPIAGPGLTMTASLTSEFRVALADFDNGATLEGMADFGHTVTLTGIEVLDETDTPVAGWSLTSTSGTQYPVPEPASAALLTLATALLTTRRRR